MGKIWKGSFKGLVCGLAVWMGAVLVLCNLLWSSQSRARDAEYRRVLAGVVGSVKAFYPEAEEEQILSGLEEKGNYELGSRILERYGIFPEGRSGSLTASNLLLFIMAAGVLGGLFFYQRRRKKELETLCFYMDRISRGDYSLRVRDNLEDEFSGLRNEVYKLTVFYKEQAENALKNKRALADALADISHQLKTPLTSVVILADNLLENEDMEENVRKRFVREIVRQLSGMKWLVVTLLKISRLDADVVAFEEKPVPLRELAQETVRNLELDAQWKEVRIENRITEDLVVTGDRKWLAEALTNIVKNAVEHSPQGGIVELTAQENDVYIQIEVKDQGEGIRPEDQKHLFERFYQGTKMGQENVGLGLSLAKEILEKQGGFLTAESRGEGRQGSVFRIRFLKCH